MYNNFDSEKKKLFRMKSNFTPLPYPDMYKILQDFQKGSDLQNESLCLGQLSFAKSENFIPLISYVP